MDSQRAPRNLHYPLGLNRVPRPPLRERRCTEVDRCKSVRVRVGLHRRLGVRTIVLSDDTQVTPHGKVTLMQVCLETFDVILTRPHINLEQSIITRVRMS